MHAYFKDMAGTVTMRIIDPWATKVVNLGVLLLWHYIHFIVNVCYFLLGLSGAIKSYLISTGVLRKYRALDLGKLRYLAVVIDSVEARQTEKVIELLQWLAKMGVRRACFYDPEGVLERSKDVILRKLNFISLLEDSTDDASPAYEKKLILEVASKSDGKEAVARAANLLLVKYLKSKSSSEDKEENFFTEECMTEALKAVGCRGPEPDLLLVYGPARCHLGFPAWRLRYTEVVHMGPLKSMKYGALISAIYKYTLVRQNYGK
ncbi:hypothetical protein MLD38_032076 [Melastoma candidum]|uniref:Uncharacterized protein n=1 Tax=Melastoma candidum TaxID=119954 RepID=A0ACB9M3T8_9MYRT|nr:hypothetical protein MLD38_032076 [Melastoma candidum]